MNEIKRVLRKAAWRIFVIDLIRALVIALAAAVGGLIVLRLVQKLTAIEVPWAMVAEWSAAGVAVVAVLWALVTRSDRAAVARRVDEGADLRETLSTALCVAGQDDPWSKVTVETAAARAKTVDVRRAVPLTAPRFWPVPLALGLALLVVWVAMPNLDLFGKRAKAAEQQDRKIVQAKFEAKVQDATSKAEEAAKKLGLDTDKPKDPGEANKPETRTPEEIHRDAIKKVTSLKDMAEQLRKGEKGQMLDTLRNELKQLKTPGDGPLTELSQALAKGDFQQASQELQKLMEKLKAGDMSAEEKAKLAEQLQKMSEQLEKMAADKNELEKALEKAGLDKKLAADPEALKKALENAKNLTEEQKKQLSQMAQSQAKACQACNSMGQCMSKMAKAAKGGDKEGESGQPGQKGQAGQQGKEGEEGQEGASSLSDQMGQLEQLASEMEAAEAAESACEGSLASLASFSECQNPGMGECEGGLNPGTKPWSSGWSEKMGAGRGGPGRSAGGGDPGEKDAAFKAEKVKAHAKNQGGPIISSRLVEGEQVRGESQAQFAAQAAAAEHQATEAIEENVYPREYHGVIKHYFGRLNAKAKATEVKEGAGAAAPTPAPAGADKK